MMKTPLLSSEIPGLAPKRGKVRDIYDFGDQLLFVATDRISAFDWILPQGIPDKGRVLTDISEMWFGQLETSHHFITRDITILPFPQGTDISSFQGRSMVVKKTKVVPIECVVRGYITGSGWKEYQQCGSVCGIELPKGLKESEQLPAPVFTPSTKEDEGHDENITFECMVELVGEELSNELRELSLRLYQDGAKYAEQKGIIIADTKFEFGVEEDGTILLIDEVLTPDSSRFWPKDQYVPGRGQPSFDKQFVRDWLQESGWDKNSPPPDLPVEIIEKTREKYLEACRLLDAKCSL